MGSRLNTSLVPVAEPRAQPGASSLLTSFTLVELLVVMAIAAMVLGALLPALGSFLKSSGIPNAVSSINVYLRGARNYAVANNVTTAVVFVEEGGDPPQVLMFMAQSSDQAKFIPVTTWENLYLPDRILLSNDEIPDDPVVICFLPTGQLTAIDIQAIQLPEGGSLPLVGSVRSFSVYDEQREDEPREILINYYTGSVVD